MSLVTLKWDNVFIRRETIITEILDTLYHEWWDGMFSIMDEWSSEQFIQKYTQAKPRLSKIRAEIDKLKAEYDDKEE